MMDPCTPLKVMHIITRCDRGGSAINTMRTVLGHDRNRFNPVMVMGDPGKWDVQGGRRATDAHCANLTASGIRWHLLESLTRAVSPQKDLMTLRRLVQLLRQERPTIVHTHTSKAGVLGRLAAYITGIPIIIHTPHGHVFYGHFGPLASALFLTTERWLAPYTTRMIALTEGERQDHLTRGVGRPEQFSVVPSGIDLELFKQWVGVKGRHPNNFEVPHDAIIIGSVGWLTQVKGHRYLIEAVAALKPDFPQIHLVLVGCGDQCDVLQAQTNRLGIASSVTFLGERHDVPECLAAMDVFVHPSLNEGMGRGLVEAMATGRPVIACEVGGIPAIVKHRRTGVLVPPADSRALAEALRECLERPDWAKRLGINAAGSIDQGFHTSNMVRAIEEIYDESLRELSQNMYMVRSDAATHL